VPHLFVHLIAGWPPLRYGQPADRADYSSAEQARLRFRRLSARRWAPTNTRAV